MSSAKGFMPLRSFARFFHSSQRKKKMLPSPWDIATGPERWEACQIAKGNKDPFLSHPVVQGPGTKDCPNVVPSVFDRRVVMCVNCKNRVVGFTLHEGFPRRCMCNKWFVLERIPLPKVYEDQPD